MIKMINYFFSIIMMSMIFGCNKHYDNSEGLNEYFSELNIAYEDLDACLIVPLQGCSSCIDKCVSFVKKNHTNNKIHFIIVSSDLRDVKIRLGSNVWRSKSVTIDSSMLAVKKSLTYISPLIISNEQGDPIVTSINVGEIDKQLASLQRKINL
ncbi:hypothetical protein LVD15_09490 [Fulvivirga maritima]|uniref:hypothetical protein n=1 Tax=Fulvivirga maritima TaxID=2904247 RepID=UPI001F29DCF8|nr:hypothetical protein [Fulvivirga maritima]UII28639.1 hypothetical protein LVD15_09490 [Fulvivirga maritima]